jgi:hypothetical protein
MTKVILKYLIGRFSKDNAKRLYKKLFRDLRNWPVIIMTDACEIVLDIYTVLNNKNIK